MIAKRNARLADALRINPASREKATATSYHAELTAFAQANIKFLGIVEKAFAEYICLILRRVIGASHSQPPYRFIASDKKTQILPAMPPDRRKFVHDVCLPIFIYQTKA